MNFTADSKVLIQGILEPLSLIHTPLMQSYGTQIVGGISPGHGGEQHQGIPIFDLVEEALDTVGGVDIAILFVQPYMALDAALEAIAAGIRQIVIVTAGMPPLDMVKLSRKADATQTGVIGPNSPGIIIPEHLLVGIHPANCYRPGSIGLLSRSGTLTYEIALGLTRAGLGQSAAVSLGSDPVVGSSFQQWLHWFDTDDQTDIILLVGKVGNGGEELAAQYIADVIQKPVVAYVAGRSMPYDPPLGHAQAITMSRLTDLGGDRGTAASKVAAFRKAGVPVADRLADLSRLIKKELKRCSKPVHL
ncbi:MAG TPA: succinate--CoA ligase subunit alpha [Elainellaceae cyanobacterium]